VNDLLYHNGSDDNGEENEDGGDDNDIHGPADDDR